MKAAVRDTYGSPDVVELREIDRPVAADDEVLVRVRAASVNPADWYSMTGTPYVGRMQLGLLKPKSNRLGVDFLCGVERDAGAVDHAVTRRDDTRRGQFENRSNPNEHPSEIFTI